MRRRVRDVRVQLEDVGIDMANPFSDRRLGGSLDQGLRNKRVPKCMNMTRKLKILEHAFERCQKMAIGKLMVAFGGISPNAPP